MLKAMHEALAIASSKKEEFEDKIKTLKEEHQNEITQLRKQCEVDITTKMLRVDLTKIEVLHTCFIFLFQFALLLLVFLCFVVLFCF